MSMHSKHCSPTTLLIHLLLQAVKGTAHSQTECVDFILIYETIQCMQDFPRSVLFRKMFTKQNVVLI